MTHVGSKIKILGLVQRFYNVYLLPRIRDEIEFYKKLNFHMMQCLKKALYKPAAFFKGILIPLERISKKRTLKQTCDPLPQVHH